MSRPWEAPLGPAREKTGLIQGGRRKIHAVFDQGVEMVEEFDVITDKLLLRKWRKERVVGGDGKWETEIGSEGREGNEFIMMSSTQPSLSRADTDKMFEWRVRNLPYPRDVYQLAVEGQHVVVRTTNKKYFKKLLIPDLVRMGLALDPSSLSWTHAHNTLIVSYVKPQEILEKEKADALERKSMKYIRAGQ